MRQENDGNFSPPTDRMRVRRAPDRGRYDRAVIDAILDEALVCHVGFVDDGQPFVIPTLQVRVDDHAYLHGATASRMVRVLADGEPACVTVTILDGLVLARSAFHHSVNYRSVVIVGRAKVVQDAATKRTILDRLVERSGDGRSREVREPTDGELARTSLLAIPISEASAKVRTGPPKDDEEDYGLDVWAGVVPLELARGDPIPDPRLGANVKAPPYLTDGDERPSARRSAY